MRHPTLLLKIVFLICSALCVETGYPTLNLFFASLLMAVILNTVMALRPNASLLPNPIVLFVFPPLFCLMHFIMEYQRPKGEIPDDFFIGGEEPIYDRAILGSATVTGMISPGLYLTKTRFHTLQKKVQKRRGSHPERFHHDRIAGGKRTKGFRRRRDQTDGATAASGETRRKRVYRRYRGYREEWVTQRELESVAPVIIRISNEDLHEGCVLSIRFYGRGNLRRFEESDYGRYLAKQGGLAIANVSERYHVTAIDCTNIDLRGKFRRGVREALLRTGFREGALDSSLGMVLGKAGYLDRSLKRGAKELGILHLFAASGLHLGIFYVCLYFPLRLLLGRMHPVALIAPIPFCFFYLYLLGFPVSLLRSFLFISLYALKSIVHRGGMLSHHMMNTAIFMIVTMPGDFVSLSALLSFGAVTGILYFYSLIRKMIGVKTKIISILCDNAAMSLSASILTTPVLIWVFHAYSYGSPLVNTFLVPYTSVLLPLLYCGIAFDMFLPAPVVSNLLLIPARYGMELFVAIVQNFESAGLYVSYDQPLVFPMFVTLLLFVILVRMRILSGKRPDEKTLRELRIHRFGVFALLMLSGPIGYAIDSVIP